MGLFSHKSDRWERQPDDIATRIESSDIKKDWGTRPFSVFDGTKALVFSQGRLLGTLTSGQHDIDGPFRKWFAGDDPTTLVIVDDGHISLDQEISDLYDVSNISLDITVRLTCEIVSPEIFYRNVLKGLKHYRKADLLAHLQPELYDALLAFTSTREIDQLYRNSEFRRQAELQIRDRVGQSLSRLGFRLVALEVAKVSSAQFDPHREGVAAVTMLSRETDVESARLEIMQRVREDRLKDKKHAIMTGAELSDAMDQAAHDLGIKGRLREDERARLEARLEQDAADYEQQRTQGREADALDHTLELDTARRGHDRRQKALDVDAFLAIRIQEAEAKERERDLGRAGDEKDFTLAERMRDSALKAHKQKKQDDVDIMKQEAEVVGSMDTETKIAMGIGDRDALLELVRLDQERIMSPEQLLIKAAERSPDVAAALAERFRSEGRLNDAMMDQLQRQLEAERQRNREHTAQLERVVNQAMAQMGRVATAKAEASGPGDQTIVTGGGMGHPTIINPQTPHPPKAGKPDHDDDTE